MGDYAYGRAVAVTPHDTNDLPAIPWGIYVGGTAGDLHVLMLDGSEVTFDNLRVGEVHCLRVKRVFSTDTTATNIIALYHD